MPERLTKGPVGRTQGSWDDDPSVTLAPVYSTVLERPPLEGWWMASDGRWYPPELHPNTLAVAPQSDLEFREAARATTLSGAPPGVNTPSATAESDWTAEATGSSSSRKPWVALLIALVLVIAAVVVWLVAGGGSGTAGTAGAHSALALHQLIRPHVGTRS